VSSSFEREKESRELAHLSGHDQTRSGRIDCDISRHESHVSKVGEDVSVLLIRQGLVKGRRVQLKGQLELDSSGLRCFPLTQIRII